MKLIDEDTILITIMEAGIPLFVGLAFFVAPDFSRYLFGRHEDPKRASDKELRGWRIFGIVLIGIGVFIFIYNFKCWV